MCRIPTEQTEFPGYDAPEQPPSAQARGEDIVRNALALALALRWVVLSQPKR